MAQVRLLSILLLLFTTSFLVTIESSIIKKKYDTFKRIKISQKQVSPLKSLVEDIWSSEYFLDSSIGTMADIVRMVLAAADNHHDEKCTQLLKLSESYLYFKGVVENAFDELDVKLDNLEAELGADSKDTFGREAYQEQVLFYNKLVADYGKSTIGSEKKNELNALIIECTSKPSAKH